VVDLLFGGLSIALALEVLVLTPSLKGTQLQIGTSVYRHHGVFGRQQLNVCQIAARYR